MASTRRRVALLVAGTAAMSVGAGVPPAQGVDLPSVYLVSGDTQEMWSEWSIQNHLAAGDGTPTGEECGVGPGLGVADAHYVVGDASSNDAFDTGLAFYVAGQQLVAPSGWMDAAEHDSEDLPRALTVGPMPAGGVDATVEYRAMQSQQVLRSVVWLVNESSEPVTVPLTVATNLGSDDATKHPASSSGDAELTDADRWLVTAYAMESSNDPVITHVFGGPGELAAPPTGVSTQVFECWGTRGLRATYQVPLGAGQSRGLMFFNELSATEASAVGSAPRFDANPAPGDELLTGLDATELAAIANWAFPRPAPPRPSDATPPQSAVDVPATHNSGPVPVSYTASDSGSGVSRVELFVRGPGSEEFLLADTDGAGQMDGRFAFDTAGVDGTYAFYTVATDVAGNREPVPPTPDATTLFDDSASASSVWSRSITKAATFPVRYRVAEEAGAEVARVELFVRAPGSEEFVLVDTDAAPDLDGRFTYTAERDGIHRFYTRSTDTLGNVENPPVPMAASRTRVDTTAPVLRSPMAGGVVRFDISADAPLLVRGRVSEPAHLRVVVRQLGEPVRTFAPAQLSAGRFTRSWNGKDTDGHRVQVGRYRIVITATDAAGNRAGLRLPVRVTR